MAFDPRDSELGTGPRNIRPDAGTPEEDPETSPSEETTAELDNGQSGPTRPQDASSHGDPSRFEPGAELDGRYKIIRLLGKGGMGVVYQAIDQQRSSEENHVALKFPMPNPDCTEGLLQEWQEALRINHRHVCRVHDVRRVSETTFMIMEYLPQCLSHLVEGDKTLSLQDAIKIGKGICLGLQAVHDAEKLHQDLKPDNILMTEEGEAKVSDLGLVASNFQYAGTVFYMAPELLIKIPGLKPHLPPVAQKYSGMATVQSDLYSLGLIFFEMLFDSTEVTRMRIPDRNLIRKTLGDPRVDPFFGHLILGCLEPDPERRPASAQEVLQMLESIESSLAGQRVLPYNARPDGSPLRTKIVASIDCRPSEHSSSARAKGTGYAEGLATRLLAAGVDVIRIDLATCKNAQHVRQVVREVSRAIRNRENLQNQARLHAIWADLPGPLLRIAPEKDFAVHPLGVGDKFYLALGSRCDKEVDGKLLAGDRLLMDAATAMDQRAVVLEPDSKAVKNLGAFISSDGPSEAIQFFGSINSEAESVLANVAGLRLPNFQSRACLEEDLQRGVDQGEAFLVSEDKGLVLVLKELYMESEWLECEVRHSLREHSGSIPVSFRGLDCSLPTCTERDLELALAALDVDLPESPESRLLAFLGLRHVQTADELLRLRKAVEDHIGLRCEMTDRKQIGLMTPSILATIESPRGFEQRNFLLDVADGVVVGNGDLVLPGGEDSTPERRRKLVMLANKRGKPALGLCQMGPEPEAGRDTISDGFSMVQEGVDAIVLPAKITSGDFAHKILERAITVASSGEKYYDFAGFSDLEIRNDLRRSRLLSFLKDDYERIRTNEKRLNIASLACSLSIPELWALSAEASSRQGQGSVSMEAAVETLSWRLYLYNEKSKKAVKQEVTNRITESACLLAETSAARAIITASTSGRTTRMVARMRARVVTIGVTHDAINARKLLLSNGVIPVWTLEAKEDDGMEELFTYCVQRLEKNRHLRKLLWGLVIFTCGFPLRRPGTTNLIQLRDFESSLQD